MEIKDILTEKNIDENIHYILNKYCNDDIQRLQVVDEMIAILNKEKVTLENKANSFYLNKNYYINNKFKRIFRKFILFPTIILSSISVGIVSIISSKFIIFMIFCMLSFHLLIARKIMPEINILPTYFFNDEYNKFLTSIDEIDKMLILLCQTRVDVERRINGNRKFYDNSINLNKNIKYESNDKLDKPYCRIRKRK